MAKQPERKMGAAISNLAASLAAPGGLGQAMYGIAADAPRISFIAVADIAPNPDQPRRSFDAASIAELAASITRLGLLQPILVRENAQGSGPRWLIVAGERRWRAVTALAHPTIAAIVTGKDPDEAALVENVQRRDLHPVDLARAVHRLADKHHYAQADLAAALGKSKGEISKLLRILTLPPAILDQAAGVEVAKSTLYQIASAPPEAQAALWAQVQSADAPPPPAADPAPVPAAAKPGRPRQADAVSQALASFGQRVAKLRGDGLTPAHRESLAAIRAEIDRLLDGA